MSQLKKPVFLQQLEDKETRTDFIAYLDTLIAANIDECDQRTAHRSKVSRKANGYARGDLAKVEKKNATLQVVSIFAKELSLCSELIDFICEYSCPYLMSVFKQEYGINGEPMSWSRKEAIWDVISDRVYRELKTQFACYKSPRSKQLAA